MELSETCREFGHFPALPFVMLRSRQRECDGRFTLVALDPG